MPREVIDCTPVWRAAAAPPEAVAPDRPEIREQAELWDVIPAETLCGTALRDGVRREPPEPPCPHRVNAELGRSRGEEGVVYC